MHISDLDLALGRPENINGSARLQEQIRNGQIEILSNGTLDYGSLFLPVREQLNFVAHRQRRQRKTDSLVHARPRRHCNAHRCRIRIESFAQIADTRKQARKMPVLAHSQQRAGEWQRQFSNVVAYGGATTPDGYIVRVKRQQATGDGDDRSMVRFQYQREGRIRVNRPPTAEEESP
jgi:hypothetical protein